MSWKIVKVIFLVLGGLVLVFVFKTVYDSGFFKVIEPHFEGDYQKLTLEPGAEDIVIDYETGVAFISCDDRRQNEKGDKSVKGAIYALDLKNEKPKPINLTKSFKQDFHPHGIDLHRADDGSLLIFAVNHRSKYKRHSVEIFEYRGDYLRHIESIEDSALMTSPNDLVAVGERQFYVTNDHGDVTEFSRKLEDYLRLPYAYVNYYDGTKFYQVATGINYANGINILANKRLLFVSATTGRRLLVYRLPEDGRKPLEYLDDIFLNFGVDNISVDLEGNLWVAGHPKLLSFVAHRHSKSNHSPSQVVKLSVTDPQTFVREDVFLNNGEDLSGSSVAIPYENNLLIGSVYEPHVLWAKLKD